LLGIARAAAPPLGRALLDIALATLPASSALLVMALFVKLAPRAALFGIGLTAALAGKQRRNSVLSLWVVCPEETVCSPKRYILRTVRTKC
jgi:hypothetical protein